MMATTETSSMSSDFLSVTLIATAFLLLLLLLLNFAIRRCRTRGKTREFDRIPGPRQYFLGSLLNLLEVADNRKTLKVVARWCQEYGPIVKLGVGPLRVVVLSSPAHTQKLFSSTSAAHLAKSDFLYNVFKTAPWFDGLFHSSGEKWKGRRKLLNPIFRSTSSVVHGGYIPAFNECGRRVVRKLEKRFGNSPAPSQISSILLDSALTTICKITFGIDFEVDDEHRRQKYDTKRFLDQVKRFLEIVITRTLQPWLAFEPIFKRHPLSQELRSIYHFSASVLSQLTEELQAAQQQEEEEAADAAAVSSPAGRSKCILKELIDAGLPQEGIYEETMTIMIAGHESTGGTLQSLLFFLALHPSIQNKCRGGDYFGVLETKVALWMGYTSRVRKCKFGVNSCRTSCSCGTPGKS